MNIVSIHCLDNVFPLLLLGSKFYLFCEESKGQGLFLFPRSLVPVGAPAAKEARRQETSQCCGGVFIRFSFSIYCTGVARDSPYNVANAKVRKASRPSGASSPSRGGTPGTFVEVTALGLLLPPMLGLAFLVVAKGAVAVTVDGFGLVPEEAVTPYMGLMVLKGLA